MNERSREVFRRLVETYLDTGEPVGSRTLSRALSEGVSPATIRNVMQDLELLGLLDSPHVSAGRVPTQLGLRLFVDGILEVGDVSGAERAEIERGLGGEERDISRDPRPRRRPAVGPDPRREPGARAEDRGADPPYRVRLARARPGARRARHRRRPGREPAVRAAGRPDPLGDAGGGELPQRHPAGPHPRRDARRRRRRDRPPPRRARRAVARPDRGRHRLLGRGAPTAAATG